MDGVSIATPETAITVSKPGVQIRNSCIREFGRSPYANGIWVLQEALDPSNCIVVENNMLDNRGWHVESGAFVIGRSNNDLTGPGDVTHVAAAWSQAKRAQMATDGRCALERGRQVGAGEGAPQAPGADITVPVFGYKNHLNLDRRQGFTHTCALTDAAARDGHQLEAIAPTEAHSAAERADNDEPIITLKAAGPWVVALPMVLSTCVLSAQRQRTVTVVLKPWQNIQEIVENSPERTRFHLEPGIYRQQTIYPKDGQEFVGEGSVILSGAIELGKWAKEAEFWRVDGLPDPLPFHGECEAGRDLCTHREDLFFNGRLYERVKSLDDLDASKWYYEKRRAYLADDPTGQLVELGVTLLAFGGKAEDVLLRDLVVEKYASDAQSGAIFADEARGWRMVNVTARWNHGAGLSFGPETLVQGGLFATIAR